MDLPESMRAARLHRVRTPDAPEDLRVDEVPVPRPCPGEVLVRVLACGVCASDLHVVQGVTPHGPSLPQVLGHEAAGEVAAVGEGVEGWLPGDRVVPLMGRPCSICGYCRIGRENLCRQLQVAGIDTDGAMAEYVLADPRWLAPVPSTIPAAHAAILSDAVATPYHALKRAGVGEGVVTVVVGLGGLGMHAVQLAALAGATVVGVDVDPVNLERAREWGADEVVDARDGDAARAVRELTDGGADVALEFVGRTDTVATSVKSLRPGGRAAIVGLTPARMELLPTALFVANELEVVGSFGSTAADLNELVDLVEAGRLDLSRSVTHTTDLDGVGEALHRLETRDDHPIRVVVELG
ncbi:MAG: alcohol dehydrogenase catalytic domain-containing protein [Actinomycetes bacterium]